MIVKIGHASITENGRATGGVAGDQTGKEVCVRDYYNKNWDVVLRPKKKSVAEKSAKACEAGCYNKHIGYDQNQRNTLHAEAKKVGYDLSKIKTPCETDCSAFQTVCAIAGGVKKLEYTGNAPTTTTMVKTFVDSGEYIALTDSKYTRGSDYNKRGDICVKKGSHTVMILTDGAKVQKTTDKIKDVIEDTSHIITETNSEIKYFPPYNGKKISIVDALNEMKFDGSFAHRKRIASANKIIKYTGTASQNTKLFNLLKQGRLIYCK